MKKNAGLARFERELERALAAGWVELDAAGLRSEVLAYGVISPDGMESVEPFVFTRNDAAELLKERQAEAGTDLRGALAFFPVEHQGARLEEFFRAVTEAYEQIEIDEQAALENEARSIIEAVVVRVIRRLVAAGGLGDRSAADAPFLGYFGYDLGNVELAGHLRELNPPAWVDEWIAPAAEAPRGVLVSRGKTGVDVKVDALSLHIASGLVVNTSWSGLVRLWNLADLNAPAYARTDLDHGVTAHAISADGRELFLCWRDTIRKRHGAQGFLIAKRRRRELGAALAEECWAAACAPDRPWLATGAESGRIRILDTETDRVVREWPAHGGPVRALVFSRDGRTLFSGAREDGLRAWAVDEARAVFAVEMDVESITSTPDGHQLVVLSSGVHDEAAAQVVTMVDAASGVVSRRVDLGGGAAAGEFPHQVNGARCAAISHDGTRLALGVGFGCDNAHVRVLALASGDERERLMTGHEHVSGLAFFPGSARRLLFTGRHFRGAQLYEWTLPG